MNQPGILLPPPPAGHYLSFRLSSPGAAPAARAALGGITLDEGVVVGVGSPLVAALGAEVPGLRPFPALCAPGVAVPSTQEAVWMYLRGADPGEALDRARAACAALGSTVVLTEDVPSFTYRGGRDLSGFVDGTENPKDEEAVAEGLIAGGPLAGSSFVAAQRWVHDLGVMARMAATERDHTIGRRLDDDEELPEAPPTAHVKRSAQEDYDPPAFMVRRSMPYGTVAEHGLYFVAFGADLDRYERVMRRMCGLDDGVADALFRFSRPVSGGYYWCPPVRAGRLDLRAIGG